MTNIIGIDQKANVSKELEKIADRIYTIRKLADVIQKKADALVDCQRTKGHCPADISTLKKRMENFYTGACMMNTFLPDVREELKSTAALAG